MKKFIALFLTFATVLSVILIAPLTVNAENWETENNNNYDSANYLSENGNVGGSLIQSNDVDFYRITPSANGKLTVKFGHRYADSSEYWIVNIYMKSDGAYTELCSMSVHLKDNELISTPSLGVKKGISYYIKVSASSSYWHTDADYKITTCFSKTNYFEKELNDDYYTATAMSVGKRYTGSLAQSNDKDFYRITPSTNGKLTVKFEHKYADSSEYWIVNIYMKSDGTYTELCSMSVHLKDNELISTPSLGVKKGISYYIKVSTSSSYWHTDADYKITTCFSKTNYFEKELNDDYYTATAMSVGKTYTGSLAQSNDKDFYRITPKMSGKLTFKFGHKYADNSEYWIINIYVKNNGAYEELLDTTVALKDKKSLSLLTLKVKKGRNYYVKVSSSSSYWYTDADYKISTSTPSFLKKVNGKYYYVKNWIVGYKSTRIFKYSGKYRYIKNGVYTKKTGLVKCGSKYYHVIKGIRNPKEGVRFVKYNGKWYYCKKGVANLKFTGKVKYKGKYYKVKKGIRK